jgi:hypothetical protein
VLLNKAGKVALLPLTALYGLSTTEINNQLLASTGSTEDSNDNTLAESINGLYKAEVIHVRAGKITQKWSLRHWHGWTCSTIEGCLNG